MHYLDANKTAGEEARRQLHKNAAGNIEQVLAATPNKVPTIRPPASQFQNSPDRRHLQFIEIFKAFDFYTNLGL